VHQEAGHAVVGEQGAADAGFVRGRRASRIRRACAVHCPPGEHAGGECLRDALTGEWIGRARGIAGEEDATAGERDRVDAGGNGPCSVRPFGTRRRTEHRCDVRARQQLGPHVLHGLHAVDAAASVEV
jgi:hypothetical protein